VSEREDTPVAGAQTLLRALDILDCFVRDGPSLSLAEISQAVGLKPPTAHRLIKGLISRGMVVADSSRRYSLGPAVMKLAAVVMSREHDLANVAAASLERLRALTGETVSLHCVLGDERICVAELLSHEHIRMESGVGSTYPLYAGAAGKAMLAYLPERLDALLPRLTAVGPATITDEPKLRADLDAIRRRGYATSESEVVPGAASLAVPVFGSAGSVIAAINVVGPAARLSRTKLSSFRGEVRDEAAKLMHLLASPGPPDAR